MNTMELTTILRMSQKKLFNTLLRRHKQNAIIEKDYFILVQGEAPILLVSHLDTVHEKPVKTICRSEDGNILMSPEGIGGDDRCGVYALETIYQNAPVKPWLLYTCDEEIGGHGAEMFSEMYEENMLLDNISRELSNLKVIVELDRKGHNDAVYYDCDTPQLEEYITKKGYQTQFGTFSDISIVAPCLGIAAVNLSCGYYNAHTLHEYINVEELNNTIQTVMDIVAESVSDTFPVYKYKQRVYTWKKAIFNHGATATKPWNIYPYCSGRYSNSLHNASLFDNNPPANLPKEYKDMYQSLCDIYSKEELEQYRNELGDEIIAQLYEEEFGGGYYGAPYSEIINL